MWEVAVSLREWIEIYAKLDVHLTSLVNNVEIFDQRQRYHFLSYKVKVACNRLDLM